MAKKTYNDLLTAILEIPEARREDNISIKVNDEFMEIVDFYFSTEKDNDVLDKGHFILHVAE